MKQITEYPNYSITKEGDVINNKTNRKLKAVVNAFGYFQVDLCNKGKNKVLRVHRLIAQAFISNAENKPNVNHKNGKKNDNRLENLEWCTQKENVKHSWETKLCNSLKGENHSNVKLNKEQVLLIRNDNRSLRVIAKDYDLNYTTISNIKTKKIWKHL